MASGTDYKNLWDRYQSEGVPKNMSIVKFCQLNGVVYGHFENWYKRYHRTRVIPVEVVNSEEESNGQVIENQTLSQSDVKNNENRNRIRNVEIVFSNGMSVRHVNIDYQGLRQLVDKLEVLC